MFAVYVHPLAERDIEDIVDWYNNQRMGLGMEFLSELENTIESMRSNPFTYRTRYSKIRICKSVTNSHISFISKLMGIQKK
ncbi:MAG: hypothetical protein GC181_10885 [Bacteroidetes bacterium]|nr:hypothetical protein [Bacteroidota bacterium]